MNYPMPHQNVTSLPKQSALPESWIERIFQRMEGRYGALFHDRWKGCDLDNIKATWAEELAPYAAKPEAISHALKVLATTKFPPTLPEFIDACRHAPDPYAPAKLPHKPTEEEIKHQRELAGQVKEAVSTREFDGMLWAKRPKSQKAMDFIADGKKDQKRFPALAAIFDSLVADGIANEAGKLLKRWDGMQWVKA